MPAGRTYTPIATTTITTSVTEVNFTSISGNYTDLILVSVIQPANTNSPSVLMQFNSDTGSNYSATYLQGNGTTAASNRQTNTTAYTIARNYGLGDSTTGSPNIITYIQNYSNTTTNKTMITRANTPSGTSYVGVETSVGLWRSTNAITSIKVYSGTNVIASGSTFTLYGILAA